MTSVCIKQAGFLLSLVFVSIEPDDVLYFFKFNIYLRVQLSFAVGLIIYTVYLFLFILVSFVYNVPIHDYHKR